MIIVKMVVYLVTNVCYRTTKYWRETNFLKTNTAKNEFRKPYWN